MTLAEQIAAKRQRREELREELFAIERELVDAGALLAVTVASAGLLRRRGRAITGYLCRARIHELLSDGREWAARDISTRIALRHESVSAQLVRMVIEGEIRRVRNGWYQRLEPASGTDGQAATSTAVDVTLNDSPSAVIERDADGLPIRFYPRQESDK